MNKQRRHFPDHEKVAILKRHLVDKVPVSDLCDELDIPAIFQFRLNQYKLTSEGYKEISRTRILEPTYPFGGRKVAWPPPAYANHHIFVRSDKELISVSLAAKP